MRRLIAWLLIALMALGSVAAAENKIIVHTPEPTQEAPAVVETAFNGKTAVRTLTDVYMVIPSGAGEMLVRVPLNGGEPVCMDRGDDIADLIAYGGGLVYLRTTSGSTSIVSCSGSQVSTLYSFGAATASDLSLYEDKLMVLTGGMLHSVEPDSALCLKLAGAQMLEYVISGDYAYYLAGGDQMEYTAQLGDGNTAAAQAGCVYRLDLNTGESSLLLKSGGENIDVLGGKLYFHNLADAYAVRTSESAVLKGRVYSLDAQLKTLESVCAEPDSGFWLLSEGVVAWYNGALNLIGEKGETPLYIPASGAIVGCDGEMLYVWEPSLLKLTEVSSAGKTNVLYSGNLALAADASAAAVSLTTAAPTTAPGSDEAIVPSNNWYDNFISNESSSSGSSSGSSSSGSSTRPQATPIGVSPTPAPVIPNWGSSSGSSSSGSSSSGSSSSGSSSSSSSSGPAVSSTSIKYLKTTGSVHMRSEAKASSSSKGVIPEGVTVECLGKVAKYSSGAKWYKVEYKGVTGWVYGAYVKSTSSSSSSSGSNNATGTTTEVNADYIRILGGSVSLRASASKDSTRKAILHEGDVATCLGVAKTDSRGVKWYKLRYDGITGWVSSQYAQPTNDPSSSGGSSTAEYVRITGGDCSIRKSADKDSTRLGVIKEGKSARYLGSAKKDSRGVMWYKIKYDGVTGWVSSRYADLYD